MRALVVRRLLLFVPTLWAIATLTFFLVRLAPGGPFQSERDIPKSARAQLMRLYGLDRPLGQQYGRFLWNAAHGDLGPSYKYPQRQVRDIVAEGVRVSAELGAWSLLVALLVGIPAGVIAAVRRNGVADHASMALSLAGVSIPAFVLGPALVLVFALGLYWLPPALWNGPASRVLPVITLASAYVAYVARLTRAGMIEALSQDFVRTARAKGLPEHVVVLRHALPLGILPVVTFLGPAAARIVMGSIVVEQIFAIPGLGRQLVNAAFNRDYTLVLGAVLFYAAALMALNLAAELLYARLDPRVEAA
ncbi:MAG TPA: ABC transporter permease [Candidatus Acidoferrales bacterium]|nr:ABC transporter permease [Candidatus Acidoferrales bacterium]